MRQTAITRPVRLLPGGLIGCVGAAALVAGLLLLQTHRAAHSGLTPPIVAASARKAHKPVRIDRDSLEIPLDAFRSLDVHTAAARAATRPFPLPPFTGILALESDPVWTQVEDRAQLDGVIQKNNVNFGHMADTTGDRPKVDWRNRLAVWLWVFEEDLPRLQDPKLSNPLPWAVRIPGIPGASFPGHLEPIRVLIDPNQQTALAIGHVENPFGLLKAGQSVSVTIELPPAFDEIEVPATALVEDGRQSVVFVQPDMQKLRFTRRQVKVLRRFHDVVYLSAQSIRPGDRVVAGGAVFLKEALARLPQ